MISTDYKQREEKATLPNKQEATPTQTTTEKVAILTLKNPDKIPSIRKSKTTLDFSIFNPNTANGTPPTYEEFIRSLDSSKTTRKRPVPERPPLSPTPFLKKKTPSSPGIAFKPSLGDFS